jgi:cytochrome c peroxidase
LLLVAATTAAATGFVAFDFTPTELQRILQHGPWPPLPARDAGNARSGAPAAIDFGGRLFFDKRLSADAVLACASCHAPALAFADGRPRSVGRGVLDRHAPSLWNSVHERWYGWDGAADSLWSQAIRPLLDPREMASSVDRIGAVLRDDEELACRYRRAFDRAPGADAEATLVDVAKAIGAFVATLVSGRTPFDDFRDALARGDLSAAARYPVAARRGLKLFVGRGGCATCHVGPLFSNGEFADTGLPFFVRPGAVDPGRHGGITALRASPYNLLGRHSDARDGNAALKTRHVDLQHRNFGEFKVPSLRNVAETAPYMHDGQLATLEAVVDHYSELDLERLHADGEQILRPLRLGAAERADLVAFLRTLSDPAAGAWRPPTTPACRAGPDDGALPGAGARPIQRGADSGSAESIE